MTHDARTLIATPSWLDGLARLVDFGCTYDAYPASASSADADAKALTADWNAVREDLHHAIGEFTESHD